GPGATGGGGTTGATARGGWACRCGMACGGTGMATGGAADGLNAGGGGRLPVAGGGNGGSSSTSAGAAPNGPIDALRMLTCCSTRSVSIDVPTRYGRGILLSIDSSARPA